MNVNTLGIKKFVGKIVARVNHYFFIRYLYCKQMFDNESRLWRGRGRSMYQVAVEPPPISLVF